MIEIITYYNLYFDDEGYCNMYEVYDSNYWTYEEALRIVRMENAKLEVNCG